MLSVWKSYHQMVKYGQQRNQILQDLNGHEIQISMKASKNEKRFETGYQQPKSGFKHRRRMFVNVKVVYVSAYFKK